MKIFERRKPPSWIFLTVGLVWGVDYIFGLLTHVFILPSTRHTEPSVLVDETKDPAAFSGWMHFAAISFVALSLLAVLRIVPLENWVVLWSRKTCALSERMFAGGPSTPWWTYAFLGIVILLIAVVLIYFVLKG
jgi:hypothetical protein